MCEEGEGEMCGQGWRKRRVASGGEGNEAMSSIISSDDGQRVMTVSVDRCVHKWIDTGDLLFGNARLHQCAWSFCS